MEHCVHTLMNVLVVLIFLNLVMECVPILRAFLPAHLNQVIIAMKCCLLRPVNVLMELVTVTLVEQHIVILWALLFVHINQVMLETEHCVLTLAKVLMLFIIVILVIQCVLMLWALTCSCKSGYTRNRTLCTDNNECANGNHNCHPDHKMSTDSVSFFTCSSKSGHHRNWTLCTDIDECADSTHICHLQNVSQSCGLLHAHVNQVMLGMEHCVLTLMNVPMVLIIVILVLQYVLMLSALLPALLNQVMAGMEHCVLAVMNVLIVLIFVILVLQCLLMLWALLPAHLRQVMLGMEHCVLTLTNVLMLLIFVILVRHTMCSNAVGLFTCSCKFHYARNGTLCTDFDECADGTHTCHPGQELCANAVGVLPVCANQVMFGIEQCVLTLMIMLMELIIAFIVQQCMLMQWALFLPL